GSSTATVPVTVINDLVFEGNETVVVTLAPGNYVVGTTNNSATVTIADDETQPIVSINSPAAVTEGDTGTVPVTFTVSLTNVSTQTVLVDYQTVNGTATAPADYQAVNGTLTFAPGQTSKTVTVMVNGDTLDEADETFTVVLSNPTNATISMGTGTGTITDDDNGGTIALAAASSGATEGAPAKIPITRSGTNLASDVTVNYATSNGTATGDDYTAVSGTLTFGAGETSKTFTVSTNDDLLDEPNETVNLTLSN